MSSGPARDSEEHARIAASVDAHPGDADAWAVYADWLQAHGDPLGEIIALEMSPARDRNPALRASHSRAHDLHRQALLGRLADRLDWGQVHATWHGGGLRGRLQLEWRNGCVLAARVSAEHGDGVPLDGPRSEFDNLLRELLALPVTRRMRRLILGPWVSDEAGGPRRYAPGVIADSGPRPALRELIIGDTGYPDPHELSRNRIGDIAGLYRALPDLESLRLHGCEIDLGTLEHDRLRRLVVCSHGLRPGVLEALGQARLPRLQHLEIWLTAAGRHDLLELQPELFAAQGMPALEHLGLIGCPFIADVIPRLATSALLPRLRSLDLFRALFDDAGFAALEDHADAFAGLQTLELPGDTVTGDQITVLDGRMLGPRIALRRHDHRGASLSHQDFSDRDFRAADLQAVDFARSSGSADFSWATLYGANLARVDLSSVTLNNSDLRLANLATARLSHVEGHGADLSSADLSEAEVHLADFYGANLSRANLTRASLSDVDLRAADLSGANLSWANLVGSDLRGADLTGADLRGATLRGARLAGAILTGVKNLSGNDFSYADLRDLYLGNMDLNFLNLRFANLGGVCLARANLINADLCNADLQLADLCGAELVNADLGGADLGHADLSARSWDSGASGTGSTGGFPSGANLSNANLRATTLRGANLGGCSLRGADLTCADLRRAILGEHGGVDLEGAILSGADLRDADLRGVDFTRARDVDGVRLKGARLEGAILGGTERRMSWD